MLFSKRNKYKSARDSIQIESIDMPARNRIWSLYTEKVFLKYVAPNTGISSARRVRGSNLEPFVRMIWMEFLEQATDTIADDIEETIKIIRDIHFKGEWFELFDVLEIIIRTLPNNINKPEFIYIANKVLEKECIGYRIIDDKVVQITDEKELLEIDRAIKKSPSPIKIHLRTALQLMSNRKTPNYRNSVKESISAVESSVKLIGKSGKATLGNVLKRLDLHKGFEKGISAIYGYTSDGDGIRHGLMEEPNLTFADAKFFLVLCSAFINYIFEKIS